MQEKKTKPKRWGLLKKLLNSKKLYLSLLGCLFVISIGVIIFVTKNIIVTVEVTPTTIPEIIAENKMLSIQKPINLTNYVFEYDETEIEYAENTAEDIIAEVSDIPDRMLGPVFETEQVVEETQIIEETQVIEETITEEITIEIIEETTETTAEEKFSVDDDFVLFSTYRDYENGNRKKLPMSERGQKIVYTMAKKYNLPYKVILALLGVETHWNESDGYAEAAGLYVGIGCINRKYHCEKLMAKGIDIYTLEGNIEGICYLLHGFAARFDNDINYMLMAYNGGGNYAASQKADGIKETGYIRKLMHYVESFE